MRVLTCFDDLPAAPWANGGGETTELVSLSDSAALTPELRPWRLSIARLVTTGPFSSLPGKNRTFLPTAEVVLDIDGQAVRVGPAEPVHFLGRQTVRLSELTGPCFAINLMVDEAGVGGDGARCGRGEPRMRLGEDDPALGRRFVLTLHETPAHPRFTLFALALGEAPLAVGESVVLEVARIGGECAYPAHGVS